VPLAIGLPRAPGDAPESVEFTSPGGLESSVPIARRTLIQSFGGVFSATLTSSVSRGAGQIKTFYVDVPAGERDLDVSFYAPDHSADDPVYFYLFPPADLAPAITESGNIDVTVTVTVNHVGYFELRPLGNDITGGNTVTAEELAPGPRGR